MIILQPKEGHVNGVLDGVGLVKGNDIYAAIRYVDGSTENVGAGHLQQASADYSMIYEMESDSSMDDDLVYTAEVGTLQFTASPEVDVVVFGGPGKLAEEGDWIDVTIGDLNFATRGANAIVLEFEGSEFLAYAMEVDGVWLPTIKRENPTLWGRGSQGRLSISWRAPQSK